VSDEKRGWGRGRRGKERREKRESWIVVGGTEVCWKERNGES